MNAKSEHSPHYAASQGFFHLDSISIGTGGAGYGPRFRGWPPKIFTSPCLTFLGGVFRFARDGRQLRAGGSALTSWIFWEAYYTERHFMNAIAMSMYRIESPKRR